MDCAKVQLFLCFRYFNEVIPNSTVGSKAGDVLARAFILPTEWMNEVAF
jgi:hypothetical protein